jgi:hypothetical protein
MIHDSNEKPKSSPQDVDLEKIFQRFKSIALGPHHLCLSAILFLYHLCL